MRNKMKTKKKKTECYMIVNMTGKILHGVFPKTPDGKKKAEDYLEKINKEKELKIIER